MLVEQTPVRCELVKPIFWLNGYGVGWLINKRNDVVCLFVTLLLQARPVFDVANI